MSIPYTLLTVAGFSDHADIGRHTTSCFTPARSIGWSSINRIAAVLIIRGYLPGFLVKFVSGIKVTVTFCSASVCRRTPQSPRKLLRPIAHDDHAVVITAFGVFRTPQPLSCTLVSTCFITLRHRHHHIVGMRVFWRLLLRLPRQFATGVSPGDGTKVGKLIIQFYRKAKPALNSRSLLPAPDVARFRQL